MGSEMCIRDRLLPYSAVANYSAPVRISASELQSTSPQSVGFDPIKIDALRAAIHDNTYKNIHSVLVVRNGLVAVEDYQPGAGEDGKLRDYTSATLHEIHSATKSVNSILIGIARDQYTSCSVDQKISTFFPELSDVFTSAGKCDITVKHLLAMSSGLSWNEEEVSYTNDQNDHVRMNRSADPVRYVLERPMIAIPGAEFRYNSGISIVLGEIIHRVSGMPADDYADKHLFKPLDITDYHWLKYPNGTVQTGGGLWLRPRDMAKIGLLMLNHGRWNGQQIVSRQWVQDSVMQQVRGRTYGYQWWLGSLHNGGQEVFTFGALGRGGQFILVLPELQMVTVFTGWNDGNGLGDQPYDMLQRYILPALVL